MIKRIPVQALTVGMYISDLNSDWIPDANYAKSGKIAQASTVDKIQQLGVHEVYIDTEKGLDSPEGVDAQAIQSQQQHCMDTLSNSPGERQYSEQMAREQHTANRVHTQASTLVQDLMQRVKQGQSIELEAVEQVADDMLHSLFRNQNALSCLTRIRNKDQYLMEHSVNVAILMGILAKSLGYKIETLQALVTGALLHDIGKIVIDDAILHKQGKLNSDEWAEMQRHVTYGEAVLDATEGISPIAKLVCAQHHERLDGTGYPRGLSAEHIAHYGKLAAVVDVYDAITADRVYHQGMSPTAAMKKMIEWSDSHLDKALVYQFIRCMSVYPSGTLVELASQRIAVVVQPNERQQKQPIIRLLYCKQRQQYLNGQWLDLSSTAAQDNVVRAIDPHELPINLVIADYLVSTNTLTPTTH